MAPTYASTRQGYADLWRTMHIKPEREAAFQATAKRLMKGMPRYQKVSQATGVPAALIAILHERESGADFDTYLGNGEPLNRVTRLVPEGRGPFRNFEEGAIDALHIDGLDKVKNWTLELVLFYAEKFNGFGYRNKGLRSPYLWGGTNHQQPGKYVRDGVFDPNVWDTQLGAAGVLFTLFNIDLSLYLKLESPGAKPDIPVPPPPDIEPPAPMPASPPPSSKGAATIAAGGSVAAGAAVHQAGWGMWEAIGIAVVVGVIAFAVYRVIQLMKKG